MWDPYSCGVMPILRYAQTSMFIFLLFEVSPKKEWQSRAKLRMLRVAPVLRITVWYLYDHGLHRDVIVTTAHDPQPQPQHRSSTTPTIIKHHQKRQAHRNKSPGGPCRWTITKTCDRATDQAGHVRRQWQQHAGA